MGCNRRVQKRFWLGGVGDGRQYPWLNGKQNFMVKQRAYNMNSSTKVACFLELNTKKWDVSKIRRRLRR